MSTEFISVREPHTNKLLFRYDPVRLLVEVQRRGVKTVVDLTQVQVGAAGLDCRILHGTQKGLDSSER